MAVHAVPEFANDEPWIRFHRSVAGPRVHIVRDAKLRDRPLCGARRHGLWQALAGYVSPGRMLGWSYRLRPMCAACMDIVEEYPAPA